MATTLPSRCPMLVGYWPRHVAPRIAGARPGAAPGSGSRAPSRSIERHLATPRPLAARLVGELLVPVACARRRRCRRWRRAGRPRVGAQHGCRDGSSWARWTHGDDSAGMRGAGGRRAGRRGRRSPRRPQVTSADQRLRIVGAPCNASCVARDAQLVERIERLPLGTVRAGRHEPARRRAMIPPGGRAGAST